MENNKIKGKIILKGKIKLLSPAKIGSGKKENTDTDILRDSNDNPYIPATSFVGVLRHQIKVDEVNFNLDEIWGFTNKDKSQKSRLYCSDLSLINQKDQKSLVEIRDGIRINNKTGVVDKAAKYDFEIVKKGLEFDLNIEVDVIDGDKEGRLLVTIVKLLKDSKVNIGGKTNSGFGKIKLIDEKIHYFDFYNKRDVLSWLKRDFNNVANKKFEPFKIQEKIFSISASFSLKNSILIKSYTGDPSLPDAISLKSGDTNIISGTSLKGAFRARAERIVNTLGKDKNIIKKLFGYVNSENKDEKAIKGKVKVNEVELPKFVSQMQTRIKINRFTGGTIEGALFETMPLFTDFNEKVKNVSLTIKNYEDYEIGILLLVLKDLWTGDIAIGGEKGIGRGVFQGDTALISWEDNQISLDKNFKDLPNEDKQKLENFVKALSSK